MTLRRGASGFTVRVSRRATSVLTNGGVYHMCAMVVIQNKGFVVNHYGDSNRSQVVHSGQAARNGRGASLVCNIWADYFRRNSNVPHKVFRVLRVRNGYHGANVPVMSSRLYLYRHVVCGNGFSLYDVFGHFFLHGGPRFASAFSGSHTATLAFPFVEIIGPIHVASRPYSHGSKLVYHVSGNMRLYLGLLMVIRHRQLSLFQDLYLLLFLEPLLHFFRQYLL